MIDLRPKKLDLYIIKKFLLTFALAILLIIVIVVIFDISEKIDDFVSKQAPLKSIIFDYYINFIPYFMNMFSPLFVFITVIFFTSRMAANSEIVAILSCGVSFHRMMVPYIFSAFLIFLLSLSLSLFIIPRSNHERVEFEVKYTSHDRNLRTTRNIHYQTSPGQFVFVEQFSMWNNTCYGFTIEQVEDGKLVQKVSAETAVWDSTLAGWRLNRYFIRDYGEGLQDRIRSGIQMDTVIPLTITDFYRNKLTVETIPYKPLNELIATQKLRGDKNVMYAEIEKHTRFALPFSAFVLTIMGVALSSKKKRGGIGWNIGIGIGLSFSYILFLKFSQMFVYTGAMPAWLALWMPNFIFMIITAVLYKIAPK